MQNLPGIIVAGVWGAGTLWTTAQALYYRAQVRDAVKARDEAIALSKMAMEAKQNAEEGFEKAKNFFEARQKTPLIAHMTEEQVDYIAKSLGAQLLPFSRLAETTKQ